jgi:hypothetical protein
MANFFNYFTTCTRSNELNARQGIAFDLSELKIRKRILIQEELYDVK